MTLPIMLFRYNDNDFGSDINGNVYEKIVTKSEPSVLSLKDVNVSHSLLCVVLQVLTS